MESGWRVEGFEGATTSVYIARGITDTGAILVFGLFLHM